VFLISSRHRASTRLPALRAGYPIRRRSSRSARRRPRPAGPGAVRDHDEEAVLEPRPLPRSSTRCQSHPSALPDAAPVTLSHRLGARSLGGVAIAICAGGAVMRGRFRRSVSHDPRADRHLRCPFLLAGRVVNLVTQAGCTDERFSWVAGLCYTRSLGSVAMGSATAVPWLTLCCCTSSSTGRVLRSA